MNQTTQVKEDLRMQKTSLSQRIMCISYKNVQINNKRIEPVKLCLVVDTFKY